jgi:tape measure domain-containing protein
MVSAPLLGEVGVDVYANLDRLLQGFRNGESAADRFERALSQKTGRSAQTLTRYTDQLAGSTNRLARMYDDGGRSVDRYAQSMARARTETVATARATETSMAAMRRTLLASASIITAALGLNQIRLLADGYTSFTNRLRSAGIEGQKLHDMQTKLFDIAQKYGVQLEAIGSLYGRVSQAQNDLGASNQQIMQTVEGAAAAVRVYGASTGEQAGAIRQLSQMLGNAKVQMQEFNSLNDGARPILQAVANGIDRFGGSVSKLRAEVMQGGFDTKEFFAGMQKGLPDIIAQAQTMPLTIGAGFQVLNNALGQYIGQTDQALGATQRISLGMAALANNLDVIMPILGAIILAIGARYVGAIGLATVATIRKAAADATATLAAATLATTTGRVSTTMGVSVVPTAAFGGALGGVTLQANAATAGLTRMQIVMATTSAIARSAGGALLAAFGGWVGVAILSIVGSVILYERGIAKAKAEVDDFNEQQKRAVELLRDEADRAQAAAGQIKALGTDHTTAAGYVTKFAGATGDAANALFQEAREARKARFEILALAAAKSRAQAEAASQRAAERADTLMRRRDATPYQNDPEWQALNKRAQDAETTAKNLQSAADRLNNPTMADLESDYSVSHPNAPTQGRDLKAEITDLQQQLVAAQAAHLEDTQRELLKQIKIRQRTTELMDKGLKFDIAWAQAQTEHMGRTRSGANAEPTTAFGNPLATMNVRHAFGEKRPGHMHSGVDLRAAVGTEVRAAMTGVVERARQVGDYGNLIEMKHGRGTTTRYGHLSRMSVAEGQRVEKGDVIGYSGGAPGAPGSGNSQAAHLHYEVRRGGRAVNPLKPGGFPTDEADLADEAERLANERIAGEEAFNRELQGLNDNILQAKRDENVDAETIARMEKERINGERDRQNQETENRRARGQITDIQAKELVAANERLRTLQLHAIDLGEQKRKEEEAAQVRARTHETEIEVLQAQQDMVRTATERRAIERRILAAQKEYERQMLQAIIDSPFAKPIDKDLARSGLGSLDRRYDAKAGALNRSTRDDLLGTAPEGSISAHNQDLDKIREDEREKLNIIKEALEARIITEQEAARRRVEIERDAQAQIRDIDLAQKTARLEAAQQIADGLQQIAATILGEHSKAARAMFIVSKAFAIAEAALKLQVAVANAAALPWPANIPAIATAVALGASIIGNIAAISAQFEGGGWTGGRRGRPAGMVHGEEYVIRAPYAGQNRAVLDTINAGRDPTAAMRASGGGGMGGMNVTLHNHAPGVEHDVKRIGPHDVEIIARKVVQRDAPGVVAADIASPSGRVGKALTRHTTTRTKKK